jgi:hypothetical protein
MTTTGGRRLWLSVIVAHVKSWSKVREILEILVRRAMATWRGADSATLAAQHVKCRSGSGGELAQTEQNEGSKSWF